MSKKGIAMSDLIQKFYLRQSNILRQSVAATTKMVTVEISDEDLVTLKQNAYNLCFAKKVEEGEYNVVWQAETEYLSNNQISWTPQYQLFGTNTFETSVQVVATTNTIDIGLGEQSTLTEEGLLTPAVTGGPEISITMIDEYGTIHPGVNQLSTVNNVQESTPIYVAEKAIVSGDATLTPVEKVLVWFEQNIETSTMFSTARSNSIEINMTKTNEATVRYANQEWTNV